MVATLTRQVGTPQWVVTSVPCLSWPPDKRGCTLKRLVRLGEHSRSPGQRAEHTVDQFRCGAHLQADHGDDRHGCIWLCTTIYQQYIGSGGGQADQIRDELVLPDCGGIRTQLPTF